MKKLTLMAISILFMSLTSPDYWKVIEVRPHNTEFDHTLVRENNKLDTGHLFCNTQYKLDSLIDLNYLMEGLK